MTARTSNRPSEPGFVLVGVVMFVLALGILGLSLFSLSSYEAGFFQRSLDEERATQRAAGGVELVKKLIAMQPYSMNQAKTAEGRLGIISARAWQINGGNIDSTSAVDWSRHVQILVRTRVGLSVHTVEGEFMPAPGESPYKRLITSNGLIWYNPIDVNGFNRSGTTRLERPIWQTVTSAVDTAWTAHVLWPNGRPLKTTQVPIPEVAAFIGAHLNGGTPRVAIDDTTSTPRRLSMDAGGDFDVAFFRSSAMTSADEGTAFGPNFDYFSSAATDITIHGTCVWMIPAGLRFNGRVKLLSAGGAADNLIIVAGPNGRHIEGGTDYRDIGLWFFNGLDIATPSSLRVFLVTNGSTRLEHFDGLSPSSSALGLSIFADGVFLMGPRTSSAAQMHLRYELDMDARADLLTSMDQLPSWGGSATSRFALVPGSWREQ